MSELRGVCPLTTFGVLERAAVIAPEVEAIVAPDGRRSFAELLESSLRIRAALEAAGVGRGDHVAVCIGNSLRWVELFYAVSGLGAVVVPVNTRFKSEELAYALQQSRASTLFIADRFLNIDFIQMLRGIAPDIDDAERDPRRSALPDLGRLIVLGEDVPAAGIGYEEFLRGGEGVAPTLVAEPEDVALIQYTSGTTAFPKGVLLRHLSMTANGFFSGLRIGLRAGDRFHTARPFFHVAGTTLSILSTAQHAATLVVMERFEAGEALRLFEEERCTHFSGNDTIALMLLGHPDARTRTLQLRGAWLAASPSIVKRVIDEFGAREAVVGYGLSEAAPNVAQSAWWESEEIRVSGAMLPEPGVEVRISLDGEDRAPGEVGEILVRGWNVMLGYFDMPEQTAEALEDGWLHTGDLGMLDDSGRLHYVGRLKEIIRVGGENVSPLDIENALHRHPAVRQAVVVGVPDARLVEVPFAFILPNPGQQPDPVEIIAWAKREMAGFKVPHYAHIVDEFESIGMTASGKVQKKAAAKVAIELLAREP